MTNPLNVTAFILAGGEGRRVGQQNKGLLPFKEQPLISHVIHTIKPQVQDILISANTQIDHYLQFGFPVFPDLPQWKRKGPLAGIISLYSHFTSKSEYILITPCDTPFLPSNLVSTLANELINHPEALIAYAATPTIIHPSIYLCRPYTNDYLANHLQQQHYSLRSWIFNHANIRVEFSDEHSFTNINDLETLTHNE